MAEPAERSGERDRAPTSRGLLRPRYVFPALLVLVVATVFLTPVESGRQGDERLTSHSAESQGARGFYELAGRLGWHTTRRTVPFIARDVAGAAAVPDSVRAGGEPPLDSTVVYAVLAPPSDLSGAEVGALLTAVRRGAGLLVVLGYGSTLADSLKLEHSLGGAEQVSPGGADSPDSCPAGASRKGALDWPGGRVLSFWLVPRGPLPSTAVAFARVAPPPRPRRARRTGDSTSVATSVTPDDDDLAIDEVEKKRFDPDTVALPPGDSGLAGVIVPVNAGARDAAGLRAAIVGYPLGAGRVVAVADPDWLRNDVIRVCSWNAGLQAARMLEYLAARPGGSRELVFDEYHQGFGRHPSTMRVIRRGLLETPFGRTTTQIVVAALILLAAAGARALSPRATARLARRSPLEHVGALSRAYAQIGATRLATRRLLRGIRRRRGGWGTAAGGSPRAAGGGSRESDEEFLDAVAERFPALADDVALLRTASASKVSPERLLEVGRAADRVERALAGGHAGPASTHREPAAARQAPGPSSTHPQRSPT